MSTFSFSTRACLALAAGAALTTTLPACGGDSCHTDHCAEEIDAGPVIDADPGAPDAAPQITEESIELVAGEILEGIYAAGSGDSMRIEITPQAGALFDWNIHGHAGGGTQVIDEGFDVADLDYAFEPTDSADWFVLLRNSGDTTITLDVKLTVVGGDWQDWEGH
jgi:hypothetical protein